MAYHILYSETSLKQIRRLHPQIKAAVKSNIERLQENPFTGKMLEKELSGYLSIRMKRFRIIYRINEKEHKVEIGYVGHRKDIYELFRDSIAKAF
jgi:mRNA-degrading endonuclease RelE of RelBE toxin-antitoxin system